VIGDDLVRLVELTARLRDPVHGCPWDLAQDHVSLRPYVVEEAHEVVAAIDARSPEALASELGDLLLQVLLHSRLAEETGEFTLHDVMACLEEKLVRRHPHVFGDAPKDLGLGSIRAQWDETKAAEQQHKAVLPTLLAARKLVAGAREPSPLFDLAKSSDRDVQVGGELLLAIKRSWESGVDPEIALRKAMDRIEAAGGDRGA